MPFWKRAYFPTLAIALFVAISARAESQKAHTLILPLSNLPPAGNHAVEAEVRKEIEADLRAQKILITRTEEDRQIGWADSCELLKAEISKLRSWQKHAEFSSVKTDEYWELTASLLILLPR
jgi:hypothetical protein